MEHQEQQQNQGAQGEGDGNVFANDGFGAPQDGAQQDRDRRGEVPPAQAGKPPVGYFVFLRFIYCSQSYSRLNGDRMVSFLPFLVSRVWICSDNRAF